MNKITSHFPSTRKKWKIYFKLFYPIVLGSLLFAFNGFVDNFMVGSIDQGLTALSAVNSWTAMMTGVFAGSAAVGSILLAQYYAIDDFEKVKEIVRLRHITTLVITLSFSIIAWISPDLLINVYLSKPKNAVDLASYEIAMENAREYISIIAFQWILFSISFNLGNQLREIGHGRVTMYWGFGTLSTNIILNSILIYGVGMGVGGAAIASAIARLVAIIIGIVYVIKTKNPIAINPFSIFKISKKTMIEFWKRWYIFFAVTTTMFFVVFRNIFYDRGYPVGSLGEGVGAMMVLGLTGAITNLFMTTFNAIGAMAANFVGSELGKGNIEQAKINSNELKGFNTTMAMIFAFLLVCFAFVVPSMEFLSNNDSADDVANLRHVKYSLFSVAPFFPMWIWFVTSLKNSLTGGKAVALTFIDWIFGGVIQLGWLVIIVYIIIPQSSFLQANFAASYALFFSSDIIKMIVIEIYYSKSNWAISITKRDVMALKSSEVNIEQLPETNID